MRKLYPFFLTIFNYDFEHIIKFCIFDLNKSG